MRTYYFIFMVCERRSIDGLQSLCKICICSFVEKTHSFQKFSEGFGKQEHKRTVHNTHCTRPTPLHQPWMFCSFQGATPFPSTKNWEETDTKRYLLPYKCWYFTSYQFPGVSNSPNSYRKMGFS